MTSDMQMTPPLWQKVKKELLDENERSGKAGFKLNIQKTEVIAISPGYLDSTLCFIQTGSLHDVLCIGVKEAG